MNSAILLLVSAVVIFDSSLHGIFIFAAPDASISVKFEMDTVVKLIRQYKYPVEVHRAVTVDHYELKIHRINGPYGSAGFIKSKKNYPVLLQHGLLGSSADFVLLEPNKSLAFSLADAGYDVWLGNLRGNIFSTGHAKLTPKSKNYWNFTWHESGIYDLPAQIDYICRKTNSEKIYYVGYSLGTTVFLVMTSTLPGYNNKIEKAFLMAPIAFLKHTKSSLLRNLMPFAKSLRGAVNFVSQGAFYLKTRPLKSIGQFLCFNVISSFCNNMMNLVNGANLYKYNKITLKSFFAYYPSGYSFKAIHHFSQLAASGVFRHYDYGAEGNKLQYANALPPEYDLSMVTSRVFMFVAPNDKLSTFPDAVTLSKKLVSMKKLHMIDHTGFNHLDFILSAKSKTLVYDKIFTEIGISIAIK